MVTIFGAVDAVLRSRSALRSAALRAHPVVVLFVWIICALAYGAAMGCSGEVVAGRPLQILYSAVKLPGFGRVGFEGAEASAASAGPTRQ